MTGIPASQMRIEDIRPCSGSGAPWDVRQMRGRAFRMCPACDAGPATLRVPDDEPRVPDHPNMIIWADRVDVVQWRVTRAANRDEGINP